jgi:WD40 repeat protein
MADEPITLRKTLANLPSLERGFGYNLYGNGAKGDRMSYVNGKSAFLRSLSDPSEAVIFVGEHKEPVSVAVLSPCGNYLATGDKGGRLLVWNQHNQQVKTGPCDYAINKNIMDIAWSPDSTKIVACGNGSEGMAKAIDRDSGNTFGSVAGHTKTILSCDFRQERPARIVCGGEDFSLTFHEGPPFKLNKKITDNTNYVNKAKFSPDSSKFLTVSSDMTIHAYEGKTGESLKTIDNKTVENGHTGAIYSFAWSPDGQRFLTCSADKTAKLWNYETGTVEKTFTFGKTVNDQQLSCMWLKDYVCTLSLSGAINYLDLDNPAVPKRVVQGHMAGVVAVAVDASSQVFYSADRNGTLCAWKEYQASWFSGVGHGKPIVDISLNSDGSQLVSVGLDDKIRFNDCKSQEFATNALALGGCPTTLTSGRARRDLAAVGLAQDKLVVIAGGEAKTVALPSKPLTLSFNHDDSLLAVGTHKGTIVVFKIAGNNASVAYELKEHDKPVTRVHWSPDGAHLVTSSGKRVLVYAGSQVVNPSEWEYHEALVTDVAFGDGKVASVSNDLGIIVWKDTNKWGTDRKSIKMAHRDGIVKCAWLRSDLLLTVGADSCLKVWSC